MRGDSIVRLDFFFLPFHSEIAIIVQQSKSLSQAIKNGLWLFFLPRCCLVDILGRGRQAGRQAGIARSLRCHKPILALPCSYCVVNLQIRMTKAKRAGQKREERHR